MIKSRRKRKKEGKMIPEKICLQPCRFRGGFNRDLRGYSQKSGSKKLQSLDILQDPTRTFNGDKPSFRFCPKAGKVLKCKGDKNAYEIDRDLAKASVTDILAFSASGMMCPPMLIYPYKRILFEITKRVPDDWGVAYGPAEWMRAEVFYEYTGNVFALHLGKHNVKFPANLSVDGHRTHLTNQLSELWSELGITLLSIHPNATRLHQYLDVAMFRLLKLGWNTSIPEWHRKNSDKILNNEWFAPVLDGALKKYFLHCSAILGFRACGLYPWAPEDTDFSKCLGKKLTRNATSRSCCKNTTYKMFKELAASQLTTEVKIREGKKEAKSALKGLMDGLQETSSEEPELPGSNPCDNAQSRNTHQEQRDTNNQPFDVDVAEITPNTLDENSCINNVVHTGSEIRLNDKHISLLPRSFAMAKHTEMNVYKNYRQDAICNNMYCKESFISRERKTNFKITAGKHNIAKK
jgi:hypothetical protein